MEEILETKKAASGILVIFLSNETPVSTLFSYETLIEEGINVLDLSNHPEHYAVDTDGPRIVRTDFCSSR